MDTWPLLPIQRYLMEGDSVKSFYKIKIRVIYFNIPMFQPKR